MKQAMPLSGLTILVTRPAHLSEHFCRQLQQAGAEAVRFPCLEIVAAEPAINPLKELQSYDLVIFTSQNAVLFSRPWLSALKDNETVHVAAIGKQTAAALKTLQINTDYQPVSGFNSEALLSMSKLQLMAGKRVIIVKGEGGRPLLANTLRERGAQVEYANVYRRALPAINDRIVRALQHKKVDIITLTSTETSNNLFSLLGNKDIPWLHEATLLAGSQRIAGKITADHTNPVWAADNPSDPAMLEALLTWKHCHFEQFKFHK